MKLEYEPQDEYQALVHLVEECGEVIAAAGKAMRFGLLSVNPELPPEKQETNIDWVRREVMDLDAAIKKWRMMQCKLVSDGVRDPMMPSWPY